MKIPVSDKSTLLKTARHNPDLDRLRQRAEAAELDIDDGLCAGCYAVLTETDVDAGECTQCRTLIETINDNDE